MAKKAKRAKKPKNELSEVVRKAAQNLVNFRKIVLSIDDSDEVESAPFHFDWSDVLLNGSRHTAVKGFRESAKTSYILRTYPQYCIAYPDKRRAYIVIIKDNATLAESKLQEIQREAMSNPAVCSQIDKVVDKSAKRFSVDVHTPAGEELISPPELICPPDQIPPSEKINLLFEAYGKGAAIRGLSNLDRRPDIVIVDDPQSLEDARSDTVTKHDWKWFLADVMFLGKAARIFLIGNNLGERCIIERVFAGKNELGFDTISVPILNADGTSAWPGRYTVAEIEAERENYRKLGKIDLWMREKMCVSVAEESRVFNKIDYRYFVFDELFKDSLLSRCRIKATLDPASSKENESCFRAIVVKATDVDGNWFILDVLYGRWDSFELMNKIFDTVVKWRLKDFGIEKGMLEQVLRPFIIKEQAKRQIFFNLIPLEHAKEGTKLERIKILQPRFKAHTIYFAMDAPWLSEMESELAGVTKDEIKSLYIDLVDALAMHEQVDEKPYFSSDQVGFAGALRNSGGMKSETEYDVLNR